MLAKAAVEGGQLEAALAAIEKLGATPDRSPDLVVLQIRALEGSGAYDRARGLAESLVLLHPERGPVEALAKGPKAAPVQVVRVAEPRAADPLITVARAEKYAQIGRVDRAVRTYRRLIYANPREWALQERLEELLGKPHDPRTEDLSEELPDPSVLPPDVRMPSPYDDEDEITEPSIDINEIRRQLEEANRPLPGSGDVAQELENERKIDMLDDDMTDPGAAGAFQAIGPDGEPGEIRRGGPGKKRRSMFDRKDP